MSVTLCTLFEGDYHLGAAALLNSLHRSGFTGTFVCGYRGARPAWANQTDRLAPLRVRWVEVSVSTHLTNYKPVFMQSCLHIHTPTADAIGYLDPDIVVKAAWPVLDRWMRSDGVALCEDVNASFPSGHPYRFAWNDFFARHGLVPQRTLERYYNGGFVAVNRERESLLLRWTELIELAKSELGSMDRLKHSGPDALFHSMDQDALNMALLLDPVPIHAVGPEGMDFLPGGHLLSHAAGGRKPWRGGFLREAFSGRPPGTAHKQFHRYADSPVTVLSSATLAWRRFELAAAALLGRFYRRT
jgi:hypothetical protein